MTKAHIISKLGPAHRTAPQVLSLLLLSLHRRPRPLCGVSLGPMRACAALGKVNWSLGQVRLILQTLISLDSARANYYRCAVLTWYSPYSRCSG